MSRLRPISTSACGCARRSQSGGDTLGPVDGQNGGSDIARFFRAWAANPMQVASVVPSGRALAELITSEITPGTGRVLELGPGTGVFTRALLGRGVVEKNLTLVEYGEDFARLLQLRFPQARVLRMDARHLARDQLFEAAPAGAVVSGLGLLSMPPRKVMAILRSTFGCLEPGGSLYQFTYGPRCPVPRPILDRMGLEAVRIGRTFRNLPPASVYRISRRRVDFALRH